MQRLLRRVTPSPLQGLLWGSDPAQRSASAAGDAEDAREPHDPAARLDAIRAGLVPGLRAGTPGQLTGAVRPLTERGPLPPASVPVRVRGVAGLWTVVGPYYAGQPGVLLRPFGHHPTPLGSAGAGGTYVEHAFALAAVEADAAAWEAAVGASGLAHLPPRREPTAALPIAHKEKRKRERKPARK